MGTNNRNKTVKISESNANPINEVEVKQTLTMLANALKGTYGTGEFNGGLGDELAYGYWHQYAMYWDAKLVFTATGSVTITFPFTLVDAPVRIFNVSDSSSSVYYVHKSKSITISATGKTIVEVGFVKNIKEVEI